MCSWINNGTTFESQNLILTVSLNLNLILHINNPKIRGHDRWMTPMYKQQTLIVSLNFTQIINLITMLIQEHVALGKIRFCEIYNMYCFISRVILAVCMYMLSVRQLCNSLGRWKCFWDLIMPT